MPPDRAAVPQSHFPLLPQRPAFRPPDRPSARCHGGLIKQPAGGSSQAGADGISATPPTSSTGNSVSATAPRRRHASPSSPPADPDHSTVATSGRPRLLRAEQRSTCKTRSRPTWGRAHLLRTRDLRGRGWRRRPATAAATGHLTRPTRVPRGRHPPGARGAAAGRTCGGSRASRNSRRLGVFVLDHLTRHIHIEPEAARLRASARRPHTPRQTDPTPHPRR